MYTNNEIYRFSLCSIPCSVLFAQMTHLLFQFYLCSKKTLIALIIRHKNRIESVIVSLSLAVWHRYYSYQIAYRTQYTIKLFNNIFQSNDMPQTEPNMRLPRKSTTIAYTTKPRVGFLLIINSKLIQFK